MVGLNNIYARLLQGRGRGTYLPLVVLSLRSPPLLLLHSGAVVNHPPPLSSLILCRCRELPIAVVSSPALSSLILRRCR